MIEWEIKVDGSWKSMPNPKSSGITITDEPVWSSSTGRDTSGKMQGNIVAWKTTIDIDLPPLSFADSKTVRDAIKNNSDFFDIRFRDFSTSDWTEKHVYTSNIPRTIYSINTSFRYHQEIKLQFVEQ